MVFLLKGIFILSFDMMYLFDIWFAVTMIYCIAEFITYCH